MGVGLPVVVRPIDAMIAVPVIGPIATSGVAVTAHELLLPKNFRPQLTIVSVVVTTWFSAAVTWFQREFAPQLRMHDASALQSIEPDRSWMIRMSGGSGAAPWFTDAQFKSRLDVGVASARGAASMVGDADRARVARPSRRPGVGQTRTRHARRRRRRRCRAGRDVPV